MARPDERATAEACSVVSRVLTLAPGASVERTVVRPARAVTGAPATTGEYQILASTSVLGVTIPAEASFTVR